MKALLRLIHLVFFSTAVAALTPPATAGSSPPNTTALRQFFPQAQTFVARTILPTLLPVVDKDNNTYLEARDAKGRTLGFVRPFSGPVLCQAGTDAQQVQAFDPLEVTLVLGADYSFMTLVAKGPLQRLNKEPFTPEDTARLLEIAQYPDEPAQGIDPAAQATTNRLLRVISNTRQVLQAAPAARDRERMQEALATAKTLGDRARLLARFLPTAETVTVRLEAFRAMVESYGQALQQKQPAQAEVEKRILSPDLDPEHPVVSLDQTARACYQLADSAEQKNLLLRCSKAVAEQSQLLAPGTFARLKGTAHYLAEQFQAALAPLREASSYFSVGKDPQLHQRLATVYQKLGQTEQACAAYWPVLVEHPMLEGARGALEVCRRPEETTAEVLQRALRAQEERFLESRQARTSPAVPPAVTLEGPDGKATDLPLYNKGQTTVLFVFSTWCKHCRRDLPQAIAFVEQLRKQPKIAAKVRMVGIRTAVEHEIETFEDFTQTFNPNFPIFTDATLSLGFAQISKAVGIEQTLPACLVINGLGKVRYILDFGAYDDVAAELMWAVSAVQQEASEPGALKLSADGRALVSPAQGSTNNTNNICQPGTACTHEP